MPEAVVAVALTRDECMIYTIFVLIECNVTFCKLTENLRWSV